MSTPSLTPVKNPTPRNQFRESADNISKHRKLVDSPEFVRAVHFALLEYQAMMASQTKDGNSAVACGFRNQGAIEFVGVLRTLAESESPFPPIVDRNLNHSV